MQDETETRDAEYPGRVVALVDVSGAGDAAAGLVLDDFASALFAYAWMSGAQKPQVIRYDGAGAATADASELVIALPADGGVEERLARALAVLDHPEADSTPPLVYTIAYTEGAADPAGAARLDALGATCRARSARWGGGVLLGEAGLYSGLFRSPRMGAYRRPLSQVIDRLVAAVRLGETMQETGRVTGRKSCENVPAANPGLLPLARILFATRA